MINPVGRVAQLIGLIQKVTHPAVPLFIISLIFLAGYSKFGFHVNWVIVNLTGGASLSLGLYLGKLMGDRQVSYLAIATIFLIIWASFRWVLGDLVASLTSFLWLMTFLQASALHKQLSGSKGYALAVASLYVLGATLTLHSFLMNGGWERIRSLPNVPEEGAFGMFLIFITYPSLAWNLLKYRGEISGKPVILFTSFFVATSLLMLLHGFRSDALLIMLSSVILLIAQNKRKYALTLTLVALAIFVLIDVIRGGVKLSVVERIPFRLATTYEYSSEVVDAFWGAAPKIPLWIYSVPMHPTQVIGRALFLKDYGITTSLFCGFFVVNGIPSLVTLSILVGIFSYNSYSKFVSGENPLPYSLIWPLLVTRAEIGMNQLDLVLIAAAASFNSLGLGRINPGTRSTLFKWVKG